MRGGNSFTVMGDLIDNLEFTISEKQKIGNRWRKRNQKWDVHEAHMGETLEAKYGGEITLKVRVHDPIGKNLCPYKFDNPSLAQMSISLPLNQPELDNVQLICGDLTGRIHPTDANYTNPTNENMWDVQVISKADMNDEAATRYSFEQEIRAKGNFYCRLRGTNLPPGTPYQTYPLDTDAPEGPAGPMLDSETVNIPCNDAACPAHLAEGHTDYDVEAWSDLWFYSNPIFVRVW